MVIEGGLIKADEGRALRPVGTSGPTTTTRVALVSQSQASGWEDCDYGVPPIQEEATEADKDTALRKFGVEV